MERYVWKLKINGRIQARGECSSKDEVESESGRYFLQYSEEDWDKITLEVERKGREKNDQSY